MPAFCFLARHHAAFANERRTHSRVSSRCCVCGWLFVLPVGVVALWSGAAHWSGTILPDGYSTRWFSRLSSSDLDALTTSLQVGFGVAVLGTLLGLWFALALILLGVLLAALLLIAARVPRR